MGTHHASRRYFDADLGFCSVTEGAVRQHTTGAIRSHGRGHRFDTCRAHQRKHLPRVLLRHGLPEDLPEEPWPELEAPLLRLRGDAEVDEAVAHGGLADLELLGKEHRQRLWS